MVKVPGTGGLDGCATDSRSPSRMVKLVHAFPPLPSTVSSLNSLFRRGGRHLVPLALAVVFALGAVVLTVPPADAATKPPAGLKASATGPTTLALRWTAVKGAPRYRVAYSTKSSMAGATYRRVTPAKLELTGLEPGQRYYVKVRVITAAGKALSKYTKAIKATTKAGYAAPAGLRVTGTGTTSAKLSWKSRGSGLHYRVQYADNAAMKGASYQRSGTTSASVSGLTAGRACSFEVRVITGSGTALGPYSSAVKAPPGKVPAPGTTSTSRQLRVGTFNVKCFNCEANHPNERSWGSRRGDVVRDIKAQKVDVLGVQEASQAWLPKAKGGKGQDLSQFEDLRNRLGSPWKLANSKRNNCVKAKTPTKCVYRDQGASKGTRILYNSSRLALVSQGSKLLPSPEDDRFMAWAVFTQRSSGKKFFFATTHLEPDKDWNLHVKEATTVAKEI